MLIRLLIFIILGMVIYRAVRKWSGAGTGQRKPLAGKPPAQVDDEMVKDPVCGSYFAKREAVVLERSGNVVRFCSAACRDQYLSD